MRTEPDSHKTSVRDRHKVHWPTFSELVRDPWAFLAFGFGVGLIRPGSGTWGTFLAALIWWLLAPQPSVWLGVALVLAFLLGCLACQRAGTKLGVPDHVGMVWDEMVALWLLLWALPQDLLSFFLAILFFRIFDVMKPFPIHRLETVMTGGFGVMVDDLVAAVYAWLVVMAILVVLPVIGVSL